MSEHDKAAWTAAEKRGARSFEDRLTKIIAELTEQKDESIQERVCKLEKRIKHLEAVVYEEGPPPTREDMGI